MAHQIKFKYHEGYVGTSLISDISLDNSLRALSLSLSTYSTTLCLKFISSFTLINLVNPSNILRSYFISRITSFTKSTLIFPPNSGRIKCSHNYIKTGRMRSFPLCTSFFSFIIHFIWSQQEVSVVGVRTTQDLLQEHTTPKPQWFATTKVYLLVTFHTHCEFFLHHHSETQDE